MPTFTNRSTITHKLKALEAQIKLKNNEIFRLQALLNNLPNSIYWKDSKGYYLGHNHSAAEKMKSVHLNDVSIIGKTDFDLFLADVAATFRKNDLEVIDSNSTITKEEVTRLTDGTEIVQLSTKKPLYNERGRIIGIIGSTIDISQFTNIKNDLIEQAKNSIIKSALAHTDTLFKKNAHIITKNKAVITLSPRQAECLLLLIKGKTTKLIAKILLLSPRTVEEYIDQLKYKFHCSSRSELIEAALMNGFLDAISKIL